MTDQQKQRNAVMRSAGESYKQIAKALDLSLNTVQTFCRRNMLTGKRAGGSAPKDLSMKPAVNGLLSVSNDGNTNADKTSGNLEKIGDSRGRPAVKVELEFAEEADETAIRDVLRMLMEGRR